MIAADFNLQDKRHREGRWWNKYAQGKIYQTILDELERRTRRIQTNHARSSYDTLAVIWSIHFPPRFPSIPTSMKLIDDERLIEAANRCDITAILAGHTHAPLRYKGPGMRFEIFCAGTASQHYAPKDHYVHVLNLSLDASQTIKIDWRALSSTAPTHDSFSFRCQYFAASEVPNFAKTRRSCPINGTSSDWRKYPKMLFSASWRLVSCHLWTLTAPFGRSRGRRVVRSVSIRVVRIPQA